MGDLGGLYSAAAPKVNAAKKPGEWQKFVIDFQAPRFEDGKKTANAKFVKVIAQRPGDPRERRDEGPDARRA